MEISAPAKTAPLSVDRFNRLAFRIPFYYVYVVQSLTDSARIYTGFTENLEQRLEDHNSGKNPHSSKNRPWGIKTAISFTDRQAGA